MPPADPNQPAGGTDQGNGDQGGMNQGGM
jgi:hypothetical protein